MTKRIFRAIMSVSLLVCLAGMATVFGVLYRYFDSQLSEEVKNEAEYLAAAVESYGLDVLQDLPESAERVTLVASDGTVLFDNCFDAAAMGSHADREEIQGALQSGAAQTLRRSDTYRKQMVYYAIRLSSGNILRISTTRYTAAAVLTSMIQPFLWIAFAILMLSGLLAAQVSHKIVEPLNQLDLEQPEDNESYVEIAPLLTKISWQKKTIQEQLEQAKKQQEEFAQITENMQEGLLLLDYRGDILSSNRSAMRILGISPTAKLFEGSQRQNVIALNRSESFCTAVDRVLAGEHQELILELDGGYCQMTGNPVLHDGKVEGGVLLFVDVTQQYQNEKLRREFTANVSHELKTPLTSISGFAEIMKDGLVRPEDVPQFAGKIFSESQRLITLVGDIIKISQLDEDMLPYEKEPVDLYELSEEIVSRLQERADQKGITMTLSGQPTQVMTVRKIADEVIYNLCDNAIKYNQPQGRVEISVEPGAEQVRLSVRDTGIGISPADQRRVFERFYRVDKSHSRQIGGTGLGLSIVKHGAAYLGVKVELESTLGQGSCFSLIWAQPKETIR